MIDNKNYTAQSPYKEYICDQIKSWIQSHQYLISKSGDKTYPLLERVNFLVKFHTSLDEFFMTRVLDFKCFLEKDGAFFPHNQALVIVLEELYGLLAPLLKTLDEIWSSSIFQDLRANGIFIHDLDSLDTVLQRGLREYFFREIFPILTPLAFDKTHPFPYISNLSLNLAVILRESYQSSELFVRIKVPEDQFPRLIIVPDGKQTSMSAPRFDLIFLEDLISANLDLLFPGMQIISSYPFRVTRDSQSRSWSQDKNLDIPEKIEFTEEQRHSTTVRIEASVEMDKPVCGMICDHLHQFSRIFYRTYGPIGMRDMTALYNLNRPDLKYRHYSDII
jgi:polyphosphate kinase